MQLTEQELLRRESLQKIIDMGIDPYPAAAWNVTAHAHDLKANFDDEHAETYKTETLTLAGRIMSIRVMGKASFAELQDSTGRIQLYISRDEICADDDLEKSYYNVFFKKLIDLSDFVGVRGYVFRTKTGEISIHVHEFCLLAKSLKPLPVVKTDAEGNVFDSFSDPEKRYRMRYVDMTVNAGVREAFVKRSRLIRSMRNFLDDLGLLEVETPILQPIHGGASARPFVTHHNTLDMPLYLRIANELYLKRLIVGGFDGVYEFGKMFRNEGMDRTHNPEFTALEFYVAYKDYFWMMDTTEKLLAKAALEVTGSTTVRVGDNEIDMQGPYRRLTIYDSIKEYGGVDISTMDEEALRAVCRERHIGIDGTMGRGKLVDELFSELVEPHLIQPTFITDYPVELSPLTKKHRTEAGLVERFELFVNRKEVANAYTELNDPIDQRERFEEQLALAARGDEEAMALDEDFLRALEYGMPPTAGIGFGIDRLAMLFTNNTSIQEVLFFPQMKPETRHEETPETAS